ncbi:MULTISPECIES: hypothetical protein [Sphingomonadaceae]|jgi:hypothetical protein|uniref:Outer membrane protein beta-barrel domain-containing protein n=1 Tax=Novosphingobium resinovorum TaxID=158500 RepID=A0A031JXK6_9SPHN|nr:MULTISPECIES: hypothetical protein [Sphingomonadaceae]AOR78084.1 hypothetical protein BES08_15965 [Novosphingobium resinovorum]EJU11647.1 hypothetical protein LH128_17932 [Sphingomonas sp. LH128]EZP81670.1 putative uncharacterized protein precursor [Novosphingobium resinovorum]MBF7010195.1 hypothetical protein [Novosphingobium sp. HR1a]WJM28209.1 hypothetical protein QUC32_10995 [Novosphingobium resinovorum]
MKIRLIALAGICAFAASSANAATVTAEANVARSEGSWGGELAVGVPVIQDGGFAITPAVGAFFHKRDHDGYYEDNSQCFRRSNDEQVGDGHCDNSGTKIFGKVEATYTLPMSFTLGLGARFIGNDLRAYGTAAMPLAPFLSGKVNVGDHYVAAGVQAKF